MINIEIDGKRIETKNGSTVMEAAHAAGIEIPHFCYHKKLSIAANCRMCLVQVEKAPKPLPACATPVTEGMKVFTASEQAIKAQKGVMEFLLINHPLDCPICDQGGECQLQDTAMGYGASASRYNEEKRTVLQKEIGSLISADEMSRCINCTRCVRFGQEIAGQMELGQAFRGELAEVMSFVSATVNSELSGNMIDLCPVGALTSKPFRYKARSWELSRRRSVSAHDSLGTNLAIHTKNNKVVRVLPIENEDINECWLSDKDRFAFDGLNSTERLTKPMVKQDGKWLEVEWQVALEYAANSLQQIVSAVGAEQIAGLSTGISTLEELYLLQKFVRGLGSDNIDFRLRQSDFRSDAYRSGVPWLGMNISEISRADRLLVIGSFLRKDHPLLSARIRQVVKKGAQLSVIHSTDDDLLMPVAHKAIVAPDAMVATLQQLVLVLEAQKAENPIAADSEIIEIAKSLTGGERIAVLLGNFAQQHPQASALQLLAQRIASLTLGKFGFIGESANSVGGYFAQAIPTKRGLNAAELIDSPRKAYLLLNVDPELDTANSQKSLAAMQTADLVIALSSYKSNTLKYADVILPISPFTETSGTFISTEGRVQSFQSAVSPLGDSRPAWKVLRVLGNLLKIEGFNQESSQDIRDEALRGVEIIAKLSNKINDLDIAWTEKTEDFQRISEVPIYTTDAIVRHSQPLQLTVDATPPKAWLNNLDLEKLDLKEGDNVKVRQGTGTANLTVAADKKLPKGVVRLAAGHQATATLGPMFGSITVERA